MRFSDWGGVSWQSHQREPEETSGPRHYKFGKKVVYVTKSGKELDETTVKTRIKVGIPIHVHYTTEGEGMLVDRVILDED